jgi:hypothetical protein
VPGWVHAVGTVITVGAIHGASAWAGPATTASATSARPSVDVRAGTEATIG